MKEISTIIINYNYGRFLRSCINSVLAQDYDSMEIIVVDDGSDDESDLVIKEYPSVNYIKKSHEGISSSRNTGIRAAIGKYIAFLDADDMWEPGKLHNQIIEVKKKNLDILFGLYDNFLNDPLMERSPRINSVINSRVKYSLETALIRRDVFDVVGMFNQELLFGEDTEWHYRCKMSGVSIQYSEDVVVRRRIHGSNVSINCERKADDTKRILADVLRKRCNDRKHSSNSTSV